MAKMQHTFHYALQIFGKIFSPSAFKELWVLHENVCKLPGDAEIICVWILQYVQNTRCSLLTLKIPKNKLICS
jgi:hypothetical protein